MSSRNVNFPLRSVKQGTRNAYEGIGVQRITFVASALNGGKGEHHACDPQHGESVYPQNKWRSWHQSLSFENKIFLLLVVIPVDTDVLQYNFAAELHY